MHIAHSLTPIPSIPALSRVSALLFSVRGARGHSTLTQWKDDVKLMILEQNISIFWFKLSLEAEAEERDLVHRHVIFDLEHLRGKLDCGCKSFVLFLADKEGP